MRMAPRTLPSRLLTTLVCASLAFAAGAQDNGGVRLPDLGSSANALVSPQEAQDYGAAMLRQMRGLDMVVDDAMLDDYINDLGYRLVAASDKPKDHFSFFIVKDSVINAFAAPGGYIAVNSGLIDITNSESELAGVIAHEIGHITQNHLQRAFESSKKDAPLMALVLLGAIAAGAGAHAGDAAGAVLMGGQGLMMQRQINFTRKDEVEADRVGIQTLAKAGFDPNAMAGFFERMQDTMRAGAGGDSDVPELLQTHPVNLSRISDAKSRAQALVAEQKQRPTSSTLVKAQWEKSTAPIAFVKDPTSLTTRGGKDGLDSYALMRERVRVLSDDALQMTKYYAANFDHQREFDTPANRYGYALALMRSGNGGKAVEQIQPLLTAHPDNQIIQLAMADAKLQAGRRGEALVIYADLNRQSPRNRAIALGYAKALTDNGSTAEATQAADMLRPMLDSSDEPELYRSFARATEKAGDAIRSGEAYADASYLSGRPFDAMEQLKRLLKRPDLDYYARARIQARISDLTPLVMELRKRKVQTEDNPDGRTQQLQREGENCAGRLCFSAGQR
ncbi:MULTISPECIES: M48 family metalloprotease [Dyella]|uniref:Putative beta-barrel assembly-enhancing protease n=2 Tax=Dyella TaxID=231454 RepID=A0A4R0YVG5_9GAMM|nr:MULTISPECIES: M48 family metalloprotease [Dyella]TBR38995.1 M48 family peptidase [Dyella terrae]TCI13413.1 M48 family peptidase [Dyella soli]